MYRAMVLKCKKSNVIFVFSLLLFSLISVQDLRGQEKLSWETLEDIDFKEKYDKELAAYLLIPIFGKKLKPYQNQTVTVDGYFIPVDMEQNFHVLSRYPYSACFFCGAAGPESIIELQLDQKLAKRITMDERVRFKGEMILNKWDFEHCFYILKSAEPVAIDK